MNEYILGQEVNVYFAASDSVPEGFVCKAIVIASSSSLLPAYTVRTEVGITGRAVHVGDNFQGPQGVQLYCQDWHKSVTLPV